MSVLVIASVLLEASIALSIGAVVATIGCAVLPRSSASTRRLVWAGVALSPMVAVLGRVTSFLPTAGADASHLVPDALISAVVLAWSIVAVMLCLRVALGQVRLWAWARGLSTHQGQVTRETQRLARRVGVRSLRVVRGEPGAMPVCWGFLRPMVLLPSDFAQWPAERRRAVTLHECAHLAQSDNRLAPIMDVITAIFWFHPAAWLASIRVHADSERACDEVVVACGIDAHRYARHLVALARACGRHTNVPAAAFSGRGELEERVAGLVLLPVAAGTTRTPNRRLSLFLCAMAVVVVTSLTPSVRLITDQPSPSTPVAIPGAHPASFGASLFGGR